MGDNSSMNFKLNESLVIYKNLCWFLTGGDFKFVLIQEVTHSRGIVFFLNINNNVGKWTVIARMLIEIFSCIQINLDKQYIPNSI